MKTFLGFEVSYTLWKYKIISYIQVHLVAVLKWRRLVDVFGSLSQTAP